MQTEFDFYLAFVIKLYWKVTNQVKNLTYKTTKIKIYNFFKIGSMVIFIFNSPWLNWLKYCTYLYEYLERNIDHISLLDVLL